MTPSLSISGAPTNELSRHAEPAGRVATVSVVLPVCHGEEALRSVVAELSELVVSQSRTFRIAEVILVSDGEKGAPAAVRELAKHHDFVRVIWLSRAFGLNAATFAGMAGAASDWIVTLSSDGSHNPREIGRLLEHAKAKAAPLVYAEKADGFRLVRGAVARGLGALTAADAPVDIALGWVTDRVAHCPVTLRSQSQSRRKGPGPLDRFLARLLASRKNPLRFLFVFGALCLALSFCVAACGVWGMLSGAFTLSREAGIFVLFSFFSGLLLVAMGVTVEYLTILFTSSLGKPLYLAIPDPEPEKEEGHGP